MKTLVSSETSHPRTLESSATPLYRILKSCTLSTCDVTRVADLELGSKVVSVKTVYKTCILFKSFRTRNAVTRNFVPCSSLTVVQYVNHLWPDFELSPSSLPVKYTKWRFEITLLSPSGEAKKLGKIWQSGRTQVYYSYVRDKFSKSLKCI